MSTDEASGRAMPRPSLHPLGLLLLIVAMAIAGCAAPHTDRLEPLNRPVQQFNDGLDRTLLRPAARAWVAVLPAFVRDRVGAFLSNLREPLVIVNQFLQGKPGLGVQDSARFLTNSTLGLAGLFDVAADLGLERHDEDFGQTLGVWGVAAGDYLVLPGLGGVTARDAVGDLLGLVLYAPALLGEGEHRAAAIVVDVVDTRAGLLGAEAIVEGDRYRFLRDSTLQRREYLIRDGVVEDAFLEDAFLEDDLPGGEVPPGPSANPSTGE